MRSAGALVLAAALLAPAAARGHEVLHDVVRGRAVAVRARYADGEPLAYATYEVYAPADPATPWQKGRTDRAGWVAFVPDAAGRWRVKVVDDGGHGLDVAVDATAGDASGAAPPASVGFVLRPLVGVAAIAALFALLFLLHRRQRERAR